MTDSRIDRRRAQAGAVSVMWVIFIVILWLGTLGLLYVTNADIAAADAEAQQARDDKAAFEAQFDEQRLAYKALSDAVGYNDPANPSSFSALGAMQVDVDAAKSTVGAALGGEDTSVSLEASVKGLMGQVAGLKNQVTALQQQVKAAEAARDAADSRLTSIESTYQDQVASLRQELADEQARAASQADNYERRLADLTDQQSASDSSARDLQKQLDEALAEATRERAASEAMLQAIAMRRAPVAPEEPDGRIMTVTDSGSIAFIDIGRVHGLHDGTRFEVLRRQKNGELRHRGEVVVQAVEGDMARVSLVGEADLFDPMLPGDLVRSPFFTKNEELHYFLLGEFPLSASKELVTNKLAALGGHVDDELTSKTDVLVLGQKNLAEGEFAVDLEDTAEYQQAERLGMRIVRLDALKSFLSY